MDTEQLKSYCVYEYGCLTPISGETEMTEEIYRKHQLWNQLVELEHGHRQEVRKILAVPDDPVAPLVEELKNTREKIKTARQKARSGKVDVSVLQEQAKILRERLSAAKVEQAEEKRKIKEAGKEKLKELEQERRQAVKVLTKASGLYWINYEEVVGNYDLARRRAMKEKTEIKFHRWTGEGKVTIRYQNGLPVEEVFQRDTRLQIDPVPQEAWDSPVRGTRRRLARTLIRLRVRSENRKPVWVELPMVMHRPLPPDSEIRLASIIRQRVGRKWRYKAVLTVAVPKRDHIHGKGTVAIDLGWRQVTDGLRVAYWADDAGDHGQVVLPLEVLWEFNKLPDLRAIRDKHFNEIKTGLTEWMAKNVSPDWLKEAAKHLSQWRSQGKLAWLIRQWKESRFDGDAEIFESLEYWLRRENHLYDWEANLRDQVLRRRREVYRIFAANLTRKYDTVVLEDFDLRKVTEKSSPEHGTAGVLPADKQRFIASVSELRLAIKNACSRDGVEVIEIDAKNTTIDCASCGHSEKWDSASQIWHTCPACGKLYDQDENACLNLLNRFANAPAI